MLRPQSSHTTLSNGALGLALILASCAGPRTRPVLDVDPGITRFEVVPSVSLDAMPLAVSNEPHRVDPPVRQSSAAVIEEVLRGAGKDRDAHLGTGNVFDMVMGDDHPTQLDPEQGPIDLGLRFNIDFGAGQAPYDDAMHPIDGIVAGRPGFSDSMLQLSWRERIGESYGLHGIASITRFQDESILDGVMDPEFAWFVFGVHSSF